MTIYIFCAAEFLVVLKTPLISVTPFILPVANIKKKKQKKQTSNNYQESSLQTIPALGASI